MEINLNNILHQVKAYCKNNNNRFGTLEEMGINHDKKALNYRSKIDYGIDNFYELLRCLGYGYKNDLIVGGKYKPCKQMSFDDLKILLKQFYDTYKITPIVDIHYKNKYNMPSYSAVKRLTEDNGIQIRDVYTELGFDLNRMNRKNKDYIYWLDVLKNYIKDSGNIPISSEFSNIGFPDSRWFINHCNNDKVKDYNSFIEYEIGAKPRFFMSKEMATEIIINTYQKLGHSPTQKELRPYLCSSIIKRIWGSFNNMKLELGLEILGRNNISKHIDFLQLKEILLNTCNDILKKDINKTTITTKDITNNCPVVFGTFERIFKQNNTTVREFLELNGFKYQKEGQGYVYNFEDGEVTKSQFELLFSNKLREYGLIYNKDYFRDVRYKTFISNYKGLLDCDYVININDNLVYVEIAGMLRDYKNRYKTPENIPSNSKKKYAEKLNQKESMFIKENLHYFILFPSDLTEDKIDYIFENILK